MDNLHIEDNKLKGDLLLPEIGKTEVIVIYDLEKEKVTKDEFQSLVSKSKELIRYLRKSINNIQKRVSKELTDSAYEQSDFIPQEDDYKKLEQELVIQQLNFYTDYFVVVFDAKINYPDMKIYCQLDDDMEIIDLSVA